MGGGSGGGRSILPTNGVGCAYDTCLVFFDAIPVLFILFVISIVSCTSLLSLLSTLEPGLSIQTNYSSFGGVVSLRGVVLASLVILVP